MSKFLQGTGNKIKVYVQLLPYGDRDEPEEIVLASVTASASNDYVTATVPASTADATKQIVLASGTPLVFKWTVGSGNTAQSYDFVTTIRGHETTNLAGETVEMPDVKKGTAVKIFLNDSLPSTGTFTTGAITIPARYRLSGGTTTGVTINNEKQDTYVFESEDGYSDGLVTTANWEIPFTANLIPNDLSYLAVNRGAIEGVLGREVYVWSESAPPKGYSQGALKHGVAVITNYTEDSPSDGILTYNLTFSGQGGLKYETFKV